MEITIKIEDDEIANCFCEANGYREYNPLIKEKLTKEEFIKKYFIRKLQESYMYQKHKELANKIPDVSSKIS